MPVKMSNKEEIEFLKSLPIERNIMKAVEELSELQIELIKYITKGKEGNFDINLVKDELADVLLTLELLMSQWNIKDEILLMMPVKLKKGAENAQKYGFRKGLNFN